MVYSDYSPTYRVSSALKVLVLSGLVGILDNNNYWLGTPVVTFSPFYIGAFLLKLNSRKKGTLILKGLLGNLVGLPLGHSPSQKLSLKGPY